MKPLSCFAVVALLSVPAHAVTISNCDALPRSVEINNGGEIKTLTISVGKSVESYGPMVSLKTPDGISVHAQARDTYCIRNGSLSLQTRRPFGGSRN